MRTHEADRRETEKEQLHLVGESRRWFPSSRWLTVGLVAMLLVVGLVGRSLVAGGVTNSFLADLLPWLSGTPVTIYFGDADGAHLVPISRTLNGDDDSPDGLLAALLDGPPAGAGLVQLVPDGTAVNAVSLVGTTLSVDLSDEYVRRDLSLADAALVHTLGSWPDVEDVHVTVNGMPVDISPAAGHLLFFYEPGSGLLVAEPADSISARDILSEYLAGPESGGLVGLPGDVGVLEFFTEPGSRLLQINLTYTDSVREMALDDGEAMRRVLEGLMATLTTGFSNNHFLYVDFEGRAALGLGQCADLLRRAQPPPQVLNDERLMRTPGEV